MMAELTHKSFFWAVRMGAKWLYRRVPLLMLLLVIGCQQTGIGQDKPAVPVKDTVAEVELDEQLKVNRDALFKGSINAATVLLFSTDPLARKVMLDALKQTENKAAQGAICKALCQAGAEHKPMKDKSDFIRPLLNILTTDDFAGGRLAGEALLLFEYEQISDGLEKIVTDTSLPVKARLNAMYTLRLQPDMKAVISLINIVGDTNKEVAAAAEQTLKSLGIPVGKDAEARKRTIEKLKREGQEEFLRNRLIWQEAQIREKETLLNMWKGGYLSVLGQIYGAKTDDTDKGKFLATHLSDSRKIVRLWALKKVEEWQKGTNPKLPGELGPILTSLISDPEKDVRLKTAQLLSLMGELSSAEKLLAQHKVEEYDEVRTEIFVALGAACSYALLPDSPVKISPQTRKQALDLAHEYLSAKELEKAQKGAEVIRKLLEQNGLTPAEVSQYLGWLVDRYKQEAAKADGTLRGKLLSTMAGLCAESVYKAQAKKLFKSLFEEALGDETNLVREAAVDGLTYIDKAMALKRLRDFVNDPSIIVRTKVIELIGEVGGKGDLVLLAKKIGLTGEGELAWQAMLNIFKSSSCNAGFLDKWIAEFNSTSAKGPLSDEQMVSLLETAERKAESENKTEILKRTREKLAGLYKKSGKFEQAADFYGLLYQAAETAEEREAVSADMLDLYLRWPNLEKATGVVDNCLLAKDLDPNSPIAMSIDSYFAHPPAGTDPNEVLVALSKITIREPRPMWQKQIERWKDRLGQAGKPE
ncbi:MAG: HEAT repeat domain-containing protein [Planctomycetota bacterium]|jgi:HEAT repeat protein